MKTENDLMIELIGKLSSYYLKFESLETDTKESRKIIWSCIYDISKQLMEKESKR